MPVFGKSLFETVLESMGTDEPDEEEDVVVRRPRIVAHFLAETTYGERPEDRMLGSLYEDFSEPVVAADVDPVLGPGPVPPLPPTWLDRLSDPEISEDLGLVPGMTLVEIRERRRSFARANHPDGVAPEYRDAATIRMVTANRLVEAALLNGRRAR
jgi:hypothetical protein